MISGIFRILFTLLALGAPPGVFAADRETAETAAVHGAMMPQDNTQKIATDFNQVESTLPVRPAENRPADYGPWLHIIIGFLIATGFFLYLDPKMF